MKVEGGCQNFVLSCAFTKAEPPTLTLVMKVRWKCV